MRINDNGVSRDMTQSEIDSHNAIRLASISRHESADIINQANQYLNATDFKAYNGTLTAEQTTIREQCKVILEGSFIDPPSKLITA